MFGTFYVYSLSLLVHKLMLCVYFIHFYIKFRYSYAIMHFYRRALCICFILSESDKKTFVSFTFSELEISTVPFIMP